MLMATESRTVAYAVSLGVGPDRLVFEDEIMDIRPGDTMQWYALQVIGGHEGIAWSSLAGRRFGVYVPFDVYYEVRRGQKVARRLPLLPGYVFVSTGNIEKHWQRILATPGAIGILGGEQSLARIITAAEMDTIREVEQEEFAIDLTATDAAYRGPKRKPRRSRRARIRKSIDKRRQISQLATQLGLGPVPFVGRLAWPGSKSSFPSLVTIAQNSSKP